MVCRVPLIEALLSVDSDPTIGLQRIFVIPSGVTSLLPIALFSCWFGFLGSKNLQKENNSFITLQRRIKETQMVFFEHRYYCHAYLTASCTYILNVVLLRYMTYIIYLACG